MHQGPRAVWRNLRCLYIYITRLHVRMQEITKHTRYWLSEQLRKVSQDPFYICGKVVQNTYNEVLEDMRDCYFVGMEHV